MTDKVLLTGLPGCGKTTLIKRVVKNILQRAGGFYTVEMREDGRRVGFKLVTLDGTETVFAHIDFESPDRIGKYRLNLAVLEADGVKAIREAVSERRVVVIDEIGPMEIRSAPFRDAISTAINSEAPLLATIVARSLPFTDAIKKRTNVTLIEIRPDNRDRLVAELAKTFGS